MIHFIYCYFLIGAFAGGRMWDDYRWSGAIPSLFFGAPVVLYAGLLNAAQWLARRLHLGFYFRYCFRPKSLEMEPEGLALWNDYVLKNRASNSLRDRMWRHALKLTNRRNNYTHPTSKA